MLLAPRLEIPRATFSRNCRSCGLGFDVHASGYVKRFTVYFVALLAAWLLGYTALLSTSAGLTGLVFVSAVAVANIYLLEELARTPTITPAPY